MNDQFQPTITSFKKDNFILVEGQKMFECFFIIQKGKAKVTRNIDIIGEKDETLVAGDFFGVVSAMSGHSHIETVQAVTDIDLISVE